MSQLYAVSRQLMAVGERIAGLERQLLTRPTDRGLLLSIGSLRKHRGDLEDELSEIAKAAGREICKYVVLGPGSSKVNSIASAVSAFQSLVTVTYSAVRAGGTITRVVTEADRAATNFEFSHTVAGSVGVVMTIQPDQLLFGPRRIDETMDVVNSLAAAREPMQIRALASKYGLGVIRELYKWCKVNSDNRVGAEIAWRGKATQTILIQPEEIRRMREAIDLSSETESRIITVSGTLVGANVSTRRFHFVTDRDEDLRGAFVDAISERQRASLPQKYIATIDVNSVTRFSTDEVTKTYFLERLEPLGI